MKPATLPSGAAKEPLRGRRDPAAFGHVPKEHACLGDPARAPRPARQAMQLGSCRRRDRRRRGADPGDGGECVSYNGVWAGLGCRSRPSTCTKARSTSPAPDAAGVVWDRPAGQALEGRRRGRGPLQPGRRATTRECNGGDPIGARRPAADLGLRDAGRLVRGFARVRSRQLIHRPQHLTWEEAPATR